MRLAVMAQIAAISALLCACTQGQDQAATAPTEAPPPPAGAEPAESEAWIDVPMPSAKVSLRFCGETTDGGTPVTSMSRESLTKFLSPCFPPPTILGQVVVSYDGPIEAGAAELFRRIDQLAVEIDPSTAQKWPLLLWINSGGGDVAEAMAMGNVLSKRDWAVRIDKVGGSLEARCYSACVLVYAAATHREEADAYRNSQEFWRHYDAERGGSQPSAAITDETKLGIHRVLPTWSEAGSVDELYADTERAVKLIGDYLARHGVSRTLVEDMMTVPSNQIRILQADEVERYGLGEVNSARADLDRLDILRRCGPDYAKRHENYIRDAAACWDGIRDESSLPVAQACFDSAKQRNRVPDAACPDPKVGG